jgi:hypothetical protein
MGIVARGHDVKDTLHVGFAILLFELLHLGGVFDDTFNNVFHWMESFETLDPERRSLVGKLAGPRF